MHARTNARAHMNPSGRAMRAVIGRRGSSVTDGSCSLHPSIVANATADGKSGNHRRRHCLRSISRALISLGGPARRDGIQLASHAPPPHKTRTIVATTTSRLTARSPLHIDRLTQLVQELGVEIVEDLDEGGDSRPEPVGEDARERPPEPRAIDFLPGRGGSV